MDLPTLPLTRRQLLKIYGCLGTLVLLSPGLLYIPPLSRSPHGPRCVLAVLAACSLALAALFAADPHMRRPAGSSLWRNPRQLMMVYVMLQSAGIGGWRAWQPPEVTELVPGLAELLRPWVAFWQTPVASSDIAATYIALLSSFAPIGGGRLQRWLRKAAYQGFMFGPSVFVLRGILASHETNIDGRSTLPIDHVEPALRARVLAGVRNQAIVAGVLFAVTGPVIAGFDLVQP